MDAATAYQDIDNRIKYYSAELACSINQSVNGQAEEAAAPVEAAAPAEEAAPAEGEEAAAAEGEAPAEGEAAAEEPVGSA